MLHSERSIAGQELERIQKISKIDWIILAGKFCLGVPGKFIKSD